MLFALCVLMYATTNINQGLKFTTSKKNFYKFIQLNHWKNTLLREYG